MAGLIVVSEEDLALLEKLRNASRMSGMVIITTRYNYNKLLEDFPEEWIEEELVGYDASEIDLGIDFAVEPDFYLRRVLQLRKEDSDDED